MVWSHKIHDEVKETENILDFMEQSLSVVLEKHITTWETIRTNFKHDIQLNKMKQWLSLLTDTYYHHLLTILIHEDFPQVALDCLKFLLP